MRMFAVVLMFLLSMQCSVIAARSNVVWIVIEDASPHIGCYGESAIKTSAIDGLVAGSAPERPDSGWSFGCFAGTGSLFIL